MSVCPCIPAILLPPPSQKQWHQTTRRPLEKKHAAPQGFRGCGTLSIKEDAPFLFFSVAYMLFDILKPECNEKNRLKMETPAEFFWVKLDTP